MADEQPLYHPRALYEGQLKRQYHDMAETYYEELSGKVGVNKELNALHVKAYNAAMAEVEEAKKKLGYAKAAKGWSIAGMIISFLAAVILIIVGALNPSIWWLILIGVAFAGLGIFFIVLLATKIKHALAAARKRLEELQAKADAKLKECYADMAALNAALDDTMPAQVMEKTTPIIDLDPTFSPERLCYLMERFGMQEETDPNTSVLGVTSGHIQGNPFVLEKVFRHEIQDKVYEGTLTIHWTTTYTDSKGNTHTESHSEVLHAESVHPAPAYWDETRLIFGSEAAPHLHFSRRPSGMSGKSDKENDKFVASRVKDLDKLEEKAVKAGKTFTKLGNDEFEAFFGADDRDNEVEYRLLFTALAQRNLLDLIKKPEPYGDDFIMVKDGMLTSVASMHSQNFDYQKPVEYFYHYDFKAGKERFVNYCDSFIRGLFFDLAPIISIPMYQIHKPRDYIYGNQYRANMTSFEHEAMINRMDARLFRPKEADESLPLLLKEMNAQKIGASDEVRVHSLSYKTTPMVDYVSVHGGDGRWHDVPVHWTKYDAVSCESNVGLADSKKSRPEFVSSALDGVKKYLNDVGLHFERGMLSFYLGENSHLSSSVDQSLQNIFSKKN